MTAMATAHTAMMASAMVMRRMRSVGTSALVLRHRSAATDHGVIGSGAGPLGMIMVSVAPL